MLFNREGRYIIEKVDHDKCVAYSSKTDKFVNYTTVPDVEMRVTERDVLREYHHESTPLELDIEEPKNKKMIKIESSSSDILSNVKINDDVTRWVLEKWAIKNEHPALTLNFQKVDFFYDMKSFSKFDIKHGSEVIFH